MKLLLFFMLHISGKYKDLQAAVKRNPRQRQTTLAERLRLLFGKIKREEEEELKGHNQVKDESLLADSFDQMASQMTEEQLNGAANSNSNRNSLSWGDQEFEEMASQLTDAQLRGDEEAVDSSLITTDGSFMTSDEDGSPQKRLCRDGRGSVCKD